MIESNTHKVDGVFRLRGHSPTRIENFVDAAFAFAITLLVIGGSGVPSTAEALRAAIWHIPNFAVCMGLLWVFWSAHERYSRRFGLEDSASRRLGWLLIFVVLIYVYPLRAVMAETIFYFSGGAIPSDFRIQDIADLEFAFMVYAVGIIALSLVITACYVHALRKASELGLDERERLATRFEIYSGLIAVQIAASSFVAAYVLWRNPPTNEAWLGLPGFVYFLFAVEMPVFRHYTRRRLAKATNPAASPSREAKIVGS